MLNGLEAKARLEPWEQSGFRMTQANRLRDYGQMNTSKRKKNTDRLTRAARINIRVHEHLQAALLSYAQQDGRSLSSYVERVLVEHARDKGAPLDASGKKCG